MANGDAVSLGSKALDRCGGFVVLTFTGTFLEELAWKNALETAGVPIEPVGGVGIDTISGDPRTVCGPIASHIVSSYIFNIEDSTTEMPDFSPAGVGQVYEGTIARVAFKSVATTTVCLACCCDETPPFFNLHVFTVTSSAAFDIFGYAAGSGVVNDAGRPFTATGPAVFITTTESGVSVSFGSLGRMGGGTEVFIPDHICPSGEASVGDGGPMDAVGTDISEYEFSCHRGDNDDDLKVDLDWVGWMVSMTLSNETDIRQIVWPANQ